MKTNELKGISREKLYGRYGTAIGALVFISFCMAIVTGICEEVCSSLLLYLVALFFVSLIEGVLKFGEQKIYINICMGESASLKDMFDAFKDANRAIGTQFIYLCIQIVSIIAYIFISRYGKAYGGAALLLAFVICVFILIFSIILSINYSQVRLIMHEDHQLGVIDSFKKSRILMQGNKKRYVLIVLSFIPLHLLGIITLLVGEIYIMPYYKLTLTEFYYDISKKYEERRMQQ